MTVARAALEAAKNLISERRREDFESYTIARDAATMDPVEAALIAEQDSVLALIDAALTAPDATADLLSKAVFKFHRAARRYCDGRMSTATGAFNRTVRELTAAGVKLGEPLYARDGMGRAYDGLTDAEALAAQEDMPKGHAALEGEWRERTADLLAAAKALLPALEQDEQDAVTGIFGTATYDAMDALRAAIAREAGTQNAAPAAVTLPLVWREKDGDHTLFLGPLECGQVWKIGEQWRAYPTYNVLPDQPMTRHATPDDAKAALEAVVRGMATP